MITTVEALSDAVAAAQAAGAVGIDTEFVWKRTYYPMLGLVQIGYPDGHCELIDAPAIKDWSPLFRLLEDKHTVKVLHDAQQDLVILRRASGAHPQNIFDTQRAAGFIGLSSTISLSDLLKRLLKVRLGKTETRSDWLARPLSEKQIHYAEDDVRYSVQLMREIMSAAHALGRQSWIHEEMQYYEDASIYQETDPEAVMPRVRGSGALTQRENNVLRALGTWREEQARKRNLPRTFILSDDGIVSLVKKIPDSAEAIKPCRGLTEKALKNIRTQLWKAIARGIDGDLPTLISSRYKAAPPDEGYEARVDLALALIKGTCLAEKMDSALIGNRADVTTFVLEAESVEFGALPILSGWRAEFIGNQLLNVLKGKGGVSINPETSLPQLVEGYTS